MLNPQPPTREEADANDQPIPSAAREPVGEAVQSHTGEVTARIENALEQAEEESEFVKRLREIEMLLYYGEIFENEAVVELANLLSLRDLPITNALLRRLGIKQFTLTHRDFESMPVLRLISKKYKDWMFVEDDNIPEDFGLPFDVEEEVGDELRGILVHDEQQGFGFHIANHLSTYPFYPLDAAALAALEAHGGASAFVNKEIIVRFEVGDTLRLQVQAPEVGSPP